MCGPKKKTEQEWRKLLSDEQYRVCRKKGTEPAFTGSYWDNKESGIYHCSCCGEPLFRSNEKFDSGTGWPSFFAPLSPEAVRAEPDTSHNLHRTEVRCAACDSHLGHVFPDGPTPTGQRYCINSVSLVHKPKSG